MSLPGPQEKNPSPSNVRRVTEGQRPRITSGGAPRPSSKMTHKRTGTITLAVWRSNRVIVITADICSSR
jgi:hypothetical protein